MSNLWKIVPISKNQLLDVNDSDLIENGHFRLCQTYKGGGGYDQFPYIAVQHGLVESPELANRQFIAQLYACNLDCPFCYVTRSGVWGEYVIYNTEQLIQEWINAKITHNVNVFHLMGGAPALQLKYWYEIIELLENNDIFHSDLMLSESYYQTNTIKQLNKPNVLLAVNIKGTNKEQWEQNTRKPYNERLLEYNLNQILDNLDSNRWYITFTNIPKINSEQFIEKYKLYNQINFSIDLIDYNAVDFVDSIPWGNII